jgi:hypothetical protein
MADGAILASECSPVQMFHDLVLDPVLTMLVVDLAIYAFVHVYVVRKMEEGGEGPR